MTKLSLGAMLRQNIANAEAIAEQLREEAKLLQLQKDETAVRKFFYDAQQQTIATILAGDPVKPIQVGGGSFDDVAKLTNGTDARSNISMGNHRFHPIWKEFQQWAAEQELSALWMSNTNSASHELLITPAIFGSHNA